MFGIFATIKIKPDQRDGFVRAIRETAVLSVSGEPGCIRFDVFQDLADDLATSHAQSAMARSQDWAEKGFEVTRATSVYPTEQRYFATQSSK